MSTLYQELLLGTFADTAYMTASINASHIRSDVSAALISTSAAAAAAAQRAQ